MVIVSNERIMSLYEQTMSVYEGSEGGQKDEGDECDVRDRVADFKTLSCSIKRIHEMKLMCL